VSADTGRARSTSGHDSSRATLPEQPVLDTARAQQLAGGVSDVAAGRALTTLEDHGILSRVTKRVRGRVWEAGELFELITDFEEDLANLR
jgi:hypothetical protein